MGRLCGQFVTVLVCIDEATEEKGCLKLVRGHHKRGLFRMWNLLDKTETKGMELVPCPTKPDDLIFFDDYAPHASEPNRRKFLSRLYYVTYYRHSADDNLDRDYEGRHRFYPPDIERETGKFTSFASRDETDD